MHYSLTSSVLQKCTVFVGCPNVSEDVLRIAFSRFGEIQQLQLDVSKRYYVHVLHLGGIDYDAVLFSSFSTAFITFKTPSIASTAKKEVYTVAMFSVLYTTYQKCYHTHTHQMSNGMIRGSDVHVEFASEENGYIELPPEAAKHPWAQIGEH